MSLIVALYCYRMATVTIYQQPSGQRGRIQWQRSQYESQEGRTPLSYSDIMNFLLNQPWANQRPNEQQTKTPVHLSANCFPREGNMDLFSDSYVVKPLLKTNGGRGRMRNFVRRQLFCDLVRYHTKQSLEDQNNLAEMD